MRRPWLLGLLVIVACGDSAQTHPMSLPTAVQAIVDSGRQTAWMSNGVDPWEVFVCHVPTDSQSPVYSGLPLRLPLQPETISTLLNTNVTAYFATLSNGAYRPTFRAGGEVTIAATDEPQACVDKALAASDDGARGVIAVADAEHNADQPGGFGSQGGVCGVPPCRASATRRYAYVGAADFSAEWGERPPMDLIEHELGHALGWPHSGYDASSAEPHQSALDLMGDSAAPRAVNPERRDAPDTLAVNRLAAGWLPTTAIAVIPAAGGTVSLQPSNGRSGTRLAVIALDDRRLITIELLMNEGYDDHLPSSGIAVHLIEGTDTLRRQTPLVGLAPYADLLTPGETVTSNGWSITIEDGWRATARPVAAAPTVST